MKMKVLGAFVFAAIAPSIIVVMIDGSTERYSAQTPQDLKEAIRTIERECIDARFASIPTGKLPETREEFEARNKKYEELRAHADAICAVMKEAHEL